MTNPHHPFVYRYFEIRHVGDRGDRFDADVIETRAGWAWSARYSDAAPTDGDESTIMDEMDAPGGRGLATEDEAVAAAVAWLRARCVTDLTRALGGDERRPLEWGTLIESVRAAVAERGELAATLTALALTDLSGPARHALATADQFGCLMPSYCGSPVADELRRYGLSKASMDPRWEGWEQLTDIGKAVRAAAGVKS